MGAWGHGLFQNDWDYEIVSDLDDEVGLKRLEEDMKAKAKSQDGADEPMLDICSDPTPTTPSNPGMGLGMLSLGNGLSYLTSGRVEIPTTGAEPAMEASGPKFENPSKARSIHGVCLTMYKGGSHPHVVRNFLDSHGTLTGLINKYALQSATGYQGDDIFSPSYQLVIIGASAMSVGCQLSDDFKNTLKKICDKVGLGDKGCEQMKKALYGPKGYRDGFPYDFRSPNLGETANSMRRCWAMTSPSGFRLLNVMGGPGTIAYKGVHKDAGKIVKECMAIVDKEYPDDVCGACGAAQGENGTLLTCGRCSKQRYRGKECQKSHWRSHKNFCVVPSIVSN